MIFLFYYFNATPKIQNCKQAAPVAHFAKRNTKFGGGKRGRGGHSFSPHPFFCPPRPSGLVLATPQARNQFRSKWVRALFKISHSTRKKSLSESDFLLRNYRTDRYPPGTPFLDSTICQSWILRVRKAPAQTRR